MPEYEYRCKSCEQVSTIERSMSASEENCNCLHCGSSDMSRIWSASFVSGSAKGQTAKSGAAEMCASNPSKPKSCCPCS